MRFFVMAIPPASEAAPPGKAPGGGSFHQIFYAMGAGAVNIFPPANLYGS
jgi:hypothetical protein